VQTNRPDRWINTAAFSLIEIVTVLVVIGIILTIAMWKIDIAKYQINGDQQVVGTALISAQRQAIARQSNVIVVFDATHSTMRIINDANNNGSLDGTETERSIALGDRVRYGLGTAPAMPWGASAISFTQLEGASGQPSVTFYRDGSASESRGIYLCSTRAQTDAAYVRDVRAIHVERATGRAEWWHYDGSKWIRGF
jgi:prepilin-type N-terminal cleavage/methylation domain-containing protein